MPFNDLLNAHDDQGGPVDSMDNISGRRMRGVSRVSRAVPRGFSPSALKALRRAQDIEVADLARVSGVGTATISQWERGTRTPQIDKLFAVITKLAANPAEADVLMETVITVPRASRMISDWRALRGVLQPELARELGISTMGLSNAERGVTPLRDDMVPALARVLRISTEEVEQAWRVARERPVR